MKTIYGAIGGLAAGFIGAIFLAPKSGKETRSNISAISNDRLYKMRMAYQKMALKMGIGSRKKIADLTKEKMDAVNRNKKTHANVDPAAREDHRSLKKIHESSAATKAVEGSSDKSQLRKVPIKTG